jgi:dTMP kinase
MKRGKYVAVEGTQDGLGKSTQAALLAGYLDALLTREPGGTPEGSALRDIVLAEGADISPQTACLIMAADRSAHIAKVVIPAVASGRPVVSDRSIWSSLAYQQAEGLTAKEIFAVNRIATGGVLPDVTILFTATLAEIESRPERAVPKDRFETADRTFKERVRENYLALPELYPHLTRWVVVDASGTPEAVFARTLAALKG